MTASRAARLPTGRRGETKLFDSAGSKTRIHGLVDRLALNLSRRRGPHRGELRLDRRRVYILPTRAGLLFGGAMATMLLATINYSLSLGYVLTFLLAAVGLVSMLHTWRNLAGIVLRPGRADPVHAGQIAEMNLTLVNPAGQIRYAVQVESPGGTMPQIHDLPADAERMASIALNTVERGWMPAPRFTVSTTFPLGLWRAWAYWQPDAGVLVLPQPETPAVPMPPATLGDSSADDSSLGEDDISAIRPYRDGDSMRRLAWKAMARSASGEPLTKEFAGGAGGEACFDWAQLPAGLPEEARLSRLTRWVLQADAANHRYALLLPQQQIDADNGPQHRDACLEALALFNRPAPAPIRYR